MIDTNVSPSTENDRRCRLSLPTALAAAQTASDLRGREIVLLDMRQVTSIFDYFVIVTGTSRRQLHAMSEEIDRRLEQELGERRLGIEGYAESRWILLDYGSVVVHLFDEPTRRYFALEDLWASAGQVPWTPDAPPGDRASPAHA